MSAEPYTAAEHEANLNRWMDLTDRQRSEAFYTLHSYCGASAEIGGEFMAQKLRALLAKAEQS